MPDMISMMKTKN